MKGVMIQGTASDVGKSVLATGLCRLLVQRGFRVSPFKAQNMSRLSANIDGTKEMAVSQYQQAHAARRTPAPWMNPILLKPTEKRQTEVFLSGESQGTISGMRFKDMYYDKALEIIKESLLQAESTSDFVIMEGAGSPVEMNLQDRDLSNMGIAELADIPVLLVADIERGGIFASIVGTLALLPDAARARVKGIIVNKFIGNPDFFAAGKAWLEDYTGLPVLGVIPFIDHQLPEEDRLSRKESFSVKPTWDPEAEYEKLAAHLELHLNMDKLFEIMRDVTDAE
jgi:adenosylcobyric acid synthase